MCIYHFGPFCQQLNVQKVFTRIRRQTIVKNVLLATISLPAEKPHAVCVHWERQLPARGRMMKYNVTVWQATFELSLLPLHMTI